MKSLKLKSNFVSIWNIRAINSALIFITLSVGTVFTACSKNIVRDDSVQTVQQVRIYVGTIITKAQSVDAYGRPFIRNYQGKVQIEVSQPLRAVNAGQVENNPFHFSMSPYPVAAAGDEGQVSIWSAAVVLQGFMTKELLVQYWHINQNGNAIIGTLTNPQNSMAASANLINLPHHIPGGAGFTIPMPYAMAERTSFSGTITEQEIRIKLEGNAIDGVHPFVSEIVVNRTR